MLSDEYRLQLQEMHKPDDVGSTWGSTAARKIFDIIPWIEQARGETLMATPKCTILDYGSADGKFKKQVERRGLLEGYPEIQCYDPGIPEFADNNTPCWFVLCSDVLEHVEPEHLDAVLEDLHRCCSHRFYFTIAMYPALKILPDGRNAHLIIEDEPWWKEKLEQHFTIKASQVSWGKTGNKTLMVYGAPL